MAIIPMLRLRLTSDDRLVCIILAAGGQVSEAQAMDMLSRIAEAVHDGRSKVAPGVDAIDADYSQTGYLRALGRAVALKVVPDWTE